MQIEGYSIDLEKVAQTIKKKGYKTVAIQIPEGLKRYVLKIVEFLEYETHATMIVSADPCFGACDIVNNKLKNLDVEFVIHVGHTPIPEIENYCIPTTFVNALSTKDITKAVEKSLSFLEGKRIGIVTTAQHLHSLDVAENILQKNNFKPILTTGDARISTKGQILGCDFSAGMNIIDKVDCFLFIGSGTFHPVGLLLSSKKPVIAADPYTNSVKKQEIDELKDIILRQRYGAIANSKNASKFGILVGLKRGQQRMDLAYRVRKTFDAFNKKSLIIALDNFSPISLQGFSNIDCFVSIACPRIAIDDYLQYKIPIITSIELEIVLGKRKWEDYRFDQILG
ncbi:MAG: diphthamide biosynthesis enzyme Dph2 [Thermoplasmatales archaeon]|nr:MAG: diphthamide biosynthesis enzyme Dph2 [Thermoplasmatales archaeon]